MDREKLHPDPLMAANIYCTGRLDDLIQAVIKPFWGRFGVNDTDHLYYLWLFRYKRCGEHLKVRVHGPSRKLFRLKELLKEAADVYFAGTPASAVPSEKVFGDVPPIDSEDRALDDYPDRTILWTHYERSVVSLGPKPLLTDDTYAALFTRCLGMACRVILAGLDPTPYPSEREISHRFRQATLLKLVLSGLTLIDWAPEERLAYLAYHRDWLIRGVLTRKGASWQSGGDILKSLEAQSAQLHGNIGVIADLAKSRWNCQIPEADPGFASWQQSVVDLARYMAGRMNEMDGLPDPFADNLIFPSIFKAFHVVANQIGIKKLDEAFAYHLLLRAQGGDSAASGAIRRVPFISAPSPMARMVSG